MLKSYPTADECPRETIRVRLFLKGLSEPQMAGAVGMKDPRTLDEARAALDTYSSLKDDLGRIPRVRVANKAAEDEFVTQQQLHSFKEEIVLEFDKKFTKLEKLLEPQSRNTYDISTNTHENYNNTYEVSNNTHENHNNTHEVSNNTHENHNFRQHT